jgi:DNA-binding transcriptional LysR family regulator
MLSSCDSLDKFITPLLWLVLLDIKAHNLANNNRFIRYMNSPKISLDQWRAFHAVVSCGGYAQAAKLLNRSQSSVSYNVQQLQNQLGLELLKIQGRKAELTGIGRNLLTRTQHLLQLAQDIETFAASVEQGWEAEIRLVVDTAFPSDILMRSLKKFSVLCPNTRVQLTEVVLSGAEDALNEHQAELVIGSSVPTGYLQDSLMEMQFIAVAHPDHHLHQLDRKLTESDLLQQTQVVIRDSGKFATQDIGWLNAENRWSVSSIEKAINAVSAGLGFGWLPQRSIQQQIDNHQLKALNLRDGSIYSAALYLLYANKENPGPGTERLAAIIREEVRRYTMEQS